MNRLTSNKAFRRGTGVIAILAVVAISIVIVPQAFAAGKTDRGPSRAQGGQTIDRAPGDNDNIGGARYRIYSDVNENGESGGGTAGSATNKTSITNESWNFWWTKEFVLRILFLVVK
jgi:hypothetical protein